MSMITWYYQKDRRPIGKSQSVFFLCMENSTQDRDMYKYVCFLPSHFLCSCLFFFSFIVHLNTAQCFQKSQSVHFCVSQTQSWTGIRKPTATLCVFSTFFFFSSLLIHIFTQYFQKVHCEVTERILQVSLCKANASLDRDTCTSMHCPVWMPSASFGLLNLAFLSVSLLQWESRDKSVHSL